MIVFRKEYSMKKKKKKRVQHVKNDLWPKRCVGEYGSVCARL